MGRSERSGERTSALRFWSADRKSLIREGSGYWRYAPTETGIRFITQYDYKVRFGVAGRVLDLAFRPLLALATAWSFDRLRLWLERDIDPAVSFERSATHWAARLSLAFIWLYHGIIPKLLAPAGEVALATRTGVPPSLAPTFVFAAAAFEIALGLALLLVRDPRPLLALSTVLAIGLAIVTSALAPELLVAPFQPVTLGVAMAGLALAAALAGRDLPEARRCRREPPPK